MKKSAIIPLISLLSNYPGGGVPILQQRNAFKQGDTTCFTVNKTDILERYSIYYSPDRKYTVIKADDGISLKYPGTCSKIKLKDGCIYNISYSLNNKSYSDPFFIDNDGSY